MGQINTTPSVEGENGADQGNYMACVPNGEDDSTSSNLSTEGSRDPLEAVQCVKTRIDMLIEDCLNVKESNFDEQRKEDKKVKTDNVRREESPNKITENKEGDKMERENVDMNKQADDDVVDVESVDKVSECGKKVANTAVDLGDKTSGKCENRTYEEKIKSEGNHGSDKKSETNPLKMADLIKEMNATEKAQRHNKTVTTFQTFIDKVLDSSLKQVPDQDNVSTNILKLCQESMQPDAKASKTSISTTATESLTKPKFDKSVTKIKPERKITLKDHIERFLESSFREETNFGEKVCAGDSDKKKEVTGTRNGYENFNAQGLVNNMITQGLQINKLLSPPLVVNHSKNPQKIPDIRVNDSLRPDMVKNQLKEVKSEKHIHNVPYKSEVGMMRNNGYQNTVPRNSAPGPHHPQLSPGQMHVSCNDGHKHSKDIRENHHTRMTDDSRRDYSYSRHYSSEYNPETVHSHHHSVAPPGFYPRMDHNSTVTSIDQQQHGAMYPMSYTTRNSIAAAPYHPAGVPQQPGGCEEQRSPLGRPSHHPPHCMCPMCLSHQRQTLDVRDPKKEYNSQRRSPNVPGYVVSHDLQLQMRGHHLDSSQAMMRPSHSKIPPCPSAAYQTMPKLLPQHPPITSTKEYGSQLLVPGMGYPQGRRPSLPENSAQKPFAHNRGGEIGHVDHVEDYAPRMDVHARGGNHSPYPVRPSSMPSQEQSSHDAGMFMRRSPAISDSGSHSSDTSVEAPLDLSVKKTKRDVERPRSSSYSSGAQHIMSHKKLNPSNTFLRHLENSVDKYCQELNGPMESPGKHVRQQLNRSLTPNESKQALPYSSQSQRLPSPHTMYNLQHRKLPSPQYTGGITMGQPLVESRSQQSIQRSGEVQYTNHGLPSVPQTSTLPVQTSIQAAISTAQSNFDMNNKRNINSISKHEPIQNIIGGHDPNDILYLICTICTQTYGSPYGFRKHFRNQHGFEPRAEHTIVQTISATKTALHGPVVPVSVASSNFQSHQTVSPPVIKSEMKESSAIIVQSMNQDCDRKSSSGSPPNRKSPNESDTLEKNSEKSKKIAQDEVSERRCLECPECGKTFQLNDFGSYKRHCRQHNTLKVTGPYTCSDCHLSFPDQKALKEHYVVHINESHVGNSDNSKMTLSGACFRCVKCDKQFDNIALYNSHILVHEQPPKLSPQIDLNTNKQNAVTHSIAPTANTLNVIPSQCIVKQAAESMTSQVCPDSSWDDSNKSVSTPVDEKQDETAVENSDSGYSSSVGSNSLLNLDDKISENLEKSPPATVMWQKSVDSNSGSNEEQQSSENSFVYKHKKFSQHRKRENPSTPHSSESTPPKQAKLPVKCQDIGPPVSSSTTSYVGFKCDSSETDDIKSTEKLGVDTGESLCINTTKDGVLVDKHMKEVNLGDGMLVDKHFKEVITGKPEARHNLPFVWDRTTRSQRKTK